MTEKDTTYLDKNTGEIMKPVHGRPSWQNRRKVIFWTLKFCVFCVCFCMFMGTDTVLYQTIVASSFTLAGAVIGYYVAGAAWTDVSIEKIKQDKPSGG